MRYLPENFYIFKQIFSPSKSDKGEDIQNILAQVKHSCWFETTEKKKIIMILTVFWGLVCFLLCGLFFFQNKMPCSQLVKLESL